MTGDPADPTTPDRPGAAGETGTGVADVWALTTAGVDGDAEPIPVPVELVPATAPVASGFPVEAMAGASVGAALAAMRHLGRRRGVDDGRAPVVVDLDHVLADWRAHVVLDGAEVPTWAPLSGRYRSRDGRPVQLHCNFPHHAAGVAARLGTTADPEAVGAAVARWDAFDLEAALIDDGMIAAAYRSLDEWAGHPHEAACRPLPLISIDRLGDAAPRPDPPVDRGDGRLGGALAGFRVLDCSRVLAGPVCGRTLAMQGADVLRIGAAHLPSVPVCVLATGFGKRNADLDLRTGDGARRFARLMAGADVFVDAYRPGALAARGYSAERAAELSPGIVVVEVSGFDWVGPWAGRRGFDSIVQSTTGVAVSQGERVGAGEPVHLPVQALDFATGYLAAFAAARLVDRQRNEGGSWRARLSLVRTRNWLVGGTGPIGFAPGGPPDVGRYLTSVESPFGTIEAVRPLDGRWDRPPAPLGSSEPVWL